MRAHTRPAHPTICVSIMATGGEGPALTAEEEAVFDRQLRVWGVQTQCALRESRVEVVVQRSGTYEPLLAAEIVKNLALAGVGSLAVRFAAPDAGVASGNGCGDGGGLAFLGSTRDAVLETLRGMTGGRSEVQVGGIDQAAPSIAVVVGSDLAAMDAHVRGIDRKTAAFAACVRGPCAFAFMRSAVVGEDALSNKEKEGDGFAAALRAAGARKRRRPTMWHVVASALGATTKEDAAPPSAEPMARLFAEAKEMPAVSAILGGLLTQEIVRAVAREPLSGSLLLFAAYGAPDAGEAHVM